jgi:hypothetical protein
MKERPILFSAPMVRAILAGRKTQTRRLIRNPGRLDGLMLAGEEANWSPYGGPGDRLWVKENWRYADWTDDGMPYIEYAADNARRLVEDVPEDWADRVEAVWARLSEPENYGIDGKAADRKWRPSIFMPRWASRITLEVTEVRVQRLQEISEKDAEAEGADLTRAEEEGVLGYAEVGPREMFAALWDDINGKRAPWSSNPWVWAITFRRVQP